MLTSHSPLLFYGRFQPAKGLIHNDRSHNLTSVNYQWQGALEQGIIPKLLQQMLKALVCVLCLDISSSTHVRNMITEKQSIPNQIDLDV